MSPQNKCVFNDKLQSQYSFLKKKTKDSEVRCFKGISIANGGNFDIQQHLKTNKHKGSDIASSSSLTISTSFRFKPIDELERKTYICEGI